MAVSEAKAKGCGSVSKVYVRRNCGESVCSVSDRKAVKSEQVFLWPCTFSRVTKIELLSVRDKAQKLPRGAGKTRAQQELASGQDQERGQKAEQSQRME